MSSVAKGLSCLVEAPVVVRFNWAMVLVHGGVWNAPGGDVDSPRLDDTRLASSVVDGSISMLSVISTAEDILFVEVWKPLRARLGRYCRGSFIVMGRVGFSGIERNFTGGSCSRHNSNGKVEIYVIICNFVMTHTLFLPKRQVSSSLNYRLIRLYKIVIPAPSPRPDSMGKLPGRSQRPRITPQKAVEYLEYLP